MPRVNAAYPMRTFRYTLPAPAVPSPPLAVAQVLVDSQPAAHREVTLQLALFDASSPPQLALPPAGALGVPYGLIAFESGKLNSLGVPDNGYVLLPGVPLTIHLPANNRLYGIVVGVLGNPAGAAQGGISVLAVNFLQRPVVQARPVGE